MVLHDPVLKEHRPPLLRACALTVVLLANGVPGLVRLFRGVSGQPFMQHFHREIPVAVLTALALTFHSDAGRLVVDLDGRVGGVPVLPARATAFAGEYLEIGLLNMHAL